MSSREAVLAKINRARTESPVIRSERSRIRSLPRRPEPGEVERELLALTMRERLRTSPSAPFLFPIQGWALHELATYGKLAGPIAVGGGKTWILALAPTVLGVARAVVFTKARLVKQTEKEIDRLRAWFDVLPRRAIRVVSYEKLSTTGLGDLIDFDPDLILTDEAHLLRNLTSNRSRRLFRWLLDRRGAGQPVRYVPLSGTMTGYSVEHYQHLYDLALDEGSPIPRDDTVEVWASVLDSGTIPRAVDTSQVARALGCDPTQEACRIALGRFSRETPGIVTSEEGYNGTGLELIARCYRPSEAVRLALDALRTRWELPDGTRLVEAVDLYRHGRTLALGFWNHREPAPGTDPELLDRYLEARRAWNGLSGKALEGSLGFREGFDSPGKLAERGRERNLPDWLQGPFDRWEHLEDAIEWVEEPRWVDEDLIEGLLLTAAAEADAPLVVWYESSSALEPYFEARGWSYFGAGSRHPTAADASDAGFVLAQQRVHGTGWNGQHDFARALLIEPPTSSDLTEQVLGRLHRPGQPADTVSVGYLYTTEEQKRAFATAHARSKHFEQTIGGRLKITSYADLIGFPDFF